jgi:hypothetical protein
MHWHRLLRRLGLARADEALDDRSRYVHRPLAKVDVAPFQPEQLALPQTGGHCHENTGSFSNAQVLYQRLDFGGHQHGWRSAALGTLTDEMDWIAVKQLVSASVIKENGHQVSNFGATALPMAVSEAKTRPVWF